jgi:hypothetical protein
MIRALVLLIATILLLVGCQYRAQATPNGQGGYVLTTTVATLEQAITRFERSARHECPGAYTLSQPAIVNTGCRATVLGSSSSRLTAQATLACTP